MVETARGRVVSAAPMGNAALGITSRWKSALAPGAIGPTQPSGAGHLGGNFIATGACVIIIYRPPRWRGRRGYAEGIGDITIVFQSQLILEHRIADGVAGFYLVGAVGTVDIVARRPPIRRVDTRTGRVGAARCRYPGPTAYSTASSEPT